MFKRPGDGFWAGLVVGILIVTLLMAFDVNVNDDDETQPIFTSDKAAQSFLDAMQTSASGTWVVNSTFVRKTTDGRVSTEKVVSARRGDNYIQKGFGVVNAQIDGRQYTCALSVDNVISGCSDVTASRSSTSANSLVKGLSPIVLGNKRSYDVAELGGGCYTLYGRAALQAGAYGRTAKFCFDPQTDALVHTEITQDGYVDSQTADSVSSSPNPTEFQLPK